MIACRPFHVPLGGWMMRLLNRTFFRLSFSQRLGNPSLCHIHAVSWDGERLHHADEYVCCHRWVSILHNSIRSINSRNRFSICQLPWWTTPQSIPGWSLSSTNAPTLTTEITRSTSRTANSNGRRASRAGSCHRSSTDMSWRRCVIDCVMRISCSVSVSPKVNCLTREYSIHKVARHDDQPTFFTTCIKRGYDSPPVIKTAR